MMLRVFTNGPGDGVQSQVESYQRLKKWYLMPPCLTLSITKDESRVRWSNPGKGLVPSPTPWCCSYQKGSLQVTLNYSCQLYFTFIYIYIYRDRERERERGKGWLVVLFYGVSTLSRLFNAKLRHFDKSFKQYSLAQVQFFCLHTVKFKKNS